MAACTRSATPKAGPARDANGDHQPKRLASARLGANVAGVRWPWLARSFVSLALLGCAAAPSGAQHAPSAAKSASERTRGDEFAAMTWEERHDQMTWVVLPNMAERFQAFTRAADATLTCRSCHGPDPESVGYRMPRGLPALDPAHLPQASDADPRGRTAKFMLETVTPVMAELLGEPLYDAKTQRGFGCFKCHPAVGAAERSAP